MLLYCFYMNNEKKKRRQKTQVEVCPWCHKKIYVLPGSKQPCHACMNLINVYANNALSNSVSWRPELFFESAKAELQDFEQALAEKLKINKEVFKNIEMRVKKLQNEINGSK